MKIENGILHSINEDEKNIFIPRTVIGIDDDFFSFFSNESIESIIAEKGNPVYHSANNSLIETKTKTLVLGCEKSIIPDDGSVTSIGRYAFNGRLNIKNIIIPENITSIGYMAFAFTGLESIIIPKSVLSIGSLAFALNAGLKEITIINKDTKIGKCAFGTSKEFENYVTIPVPSKIYPTDLLLNIPEDSSALNYCKENSINYKFI